MSRLSIAAARMRRTNRFWLESNSRIRWWNLERSRSRKKGAILFLLSSFSLNPDLFLFSLFRSPKHTNKKLKTAEAETAEQLLERASSSGSKEPRIDGRAFRRSLTKTGRYVRNPANDAASLALMEEHGVGYSSTGLVAQMRKPENGNTWKQGNLTVTLAQAYGEYDRRGGGEVKREREKRKRERERKEREGEIKKRKEKNSLAFFPLLFFFFQ